MSSRPLPPGRARLIDPRSASLFLAIVEEGSIAAAASREHIVPSAVSRRLAELETRFGVPLVERHRRGVKPTPAGEALVHHARVIQQAVARLTDEMSEYITGIRGHVRVRASASSLAAGLASEIESFMRVHQRVRLELEELPTPEVFREVAEGRADIGIGPDLVRHENLTLLPYRHYELAAAVPNDHPLAARTSVRFRELMAFDLVEMMRSSALAHLIDSAAAQISVPKRTRMRMSGFDGVCRMVLHGMGVGILPSFLGETIEWRNRLSFVPLDESWAQPPLRIVVRDVETLPSAARALVQHLMEAAGTAPGVAAATA